MKSDQGTAPTAWSGKKICEALDVSAPTIEKSRKTFVLEGLEVALNWKKQVNPSSLKFDGEKEVRLIALCCSSPPDGRKRRALRLIADKLDELEVFERISREAVKKSRYIPKMFLEASISKLRAGVRAGPVGRGVGESF